MDVFARPFPVEKHFDGVATTEKRGTVAPLAVNHAGQLHARRVAAAPAFFRQPAHFARIAGILTAPAAEDAP
jgi:hypothetical protein